MTVFLDRDGTINVNLPFPNVNRPEKVQLLPDAARGIRLLNQLGCRTLIVTNQAGLNNPENPFTLQDYQEVTLRLRELLRLEAGAEVDDEFCCPHTRDEKCSCRKPELGLFLAAQECYPDIELADCFVIGDRTDDILAGRKLKATTILVLTGHGRDSRDDLLREGIEPDFVAENLYQAAVEIQNRLQAGRTSSGEAGD